MIDEPEQIVLQPIGVVLNQVKRSPGPDYDWSRVVSTIIIQSRFSTALDGLELFSHVIVIFWMHQTTGRVVNKIHPRGKRELPLVGLFATRTPNRPNPIGESTVRLLGRQGNRLSVEGLDAIDGTPVLDIKPHIRGYDAPPDVRVPPWVRKQF